MEGKDGDVSDTRGVLNAKKRKARQERRIKADPTLADGRGSVASGRRKKAE